MSSHIIPQTLIWNEDLSSTIRWSLASPSDPAVMRLLTTMQLREEVVGLSILLDSTGSLSVVAFSGREDVVMINAKKPLAGAISRTCERFWAKALSSQSWTNSAFGMARIALHIKERFGVDVVGADIMSSVVNTKTTVTSPGLFFDKYKMRLRGFKQREIDKLWNNVVLAKGSAPSESDLKSLCLRAWVSFVAGTFACIPRPKMVNTTCLATKDEFVVAYRMALEIDLLESTKPYERKADFDSTKLEGCSLNLKNTRYNTRTRHNQKGEVICYDSSNNQYRGRTTRVDGKHTTIKMDAVVPDGKIVGAVSKGKEAPTLAEQAKEGHLFDLLQGAAKSFSPFTMQIWFPSEKDEAVKNKAVSKRRRERLNQSQADVVEAMTVGSDRIVVVHGPPGTGKTSTISAAVQKWVAQRNTAWLVAQSNVGVKNIAEKLCKDKVKFKLIVSKEFHFEWHEHIYKEQIRKHLIRSDELFNILDPRLVAGMFAGVKVVLCSLSMLSNPALLQTKLFSIVPVRNLVVDEASQIGVFEYMHLFAQFGRLEKVCFFGDPKQLPPYGLDAAPKMQSIFDIKHSQKQSYFLDTQYRMPSMIGEFISDNVYGGKLLSSHCEKRSSCSAFVDAGYSEEQRVGTSWKNQREVCVIANLVEKYYRRKNFCVITPYDGQRAALQDCLKRKRLPYENVYNVDSFQGNEADYVLISIVRTTAPGFMKLDSRVNVMLTRCKAGMVIVCSRRFMKKSSVEKTLLGKLRLHWEDRSGKEAWRSWKDVAGSKAELPGCPSPTKPSTSSGNGPTLHKVDAVVSSMESLKI